MRKVEELTMNEYIECVINSGEPNFKEYCEKNNIDYEDAIEHDWD
jgi:hypothetical protein